MTMLKSENVAGKRPAVYPQEAGVVYVSDGSYEITVAQNIDEAVVALCLLPIGCVPLDFMVVIDDLDEAASLAWIGGGISAAEDDVDVIMIASQTSVGQSAGAARATLFPMVAPLAVDTYFGIHIQTAPGTAAAGTIRGVLTYRATEYGA
jgi:hypothetical protein